MISSRLRAASTLSSSIQCSFAIFLRGSASACSTRTSNDSDSTIASLHHPLSTIFLSASPHFAGLFLQSLPPPQKNGGALDFQRILIFLEWIWAVAGEGWIECCSRSMRWVSREALKWMRFRTCWMHWWSLLFRLDWPHSYFCVPPLRTLPGTSILFWSPVAFLSPFH